LNLESDFSTFDIIVGSLGKIWAPSFEAHKIGQALNVSFAESLAASAEKAGFEVTEVDLPENVAGLAAIIAGKPHIVINRRTTGRYRDFTVAHEWGHHHLHLNPARDTTSLVVSPTEEMKEFEANLFASSLIVFLTAESEREDFQKQNPEFGRSLVMPMMLSVVAIFATLLFHVICLSPEDQTTPNLNRQ